MDFGVGVEWEGGLWKARIERVDCKWEESGYDEECGGIDFCYY